MHWFGGGALFFSQENRENTFYPKSPLAPPESAVPVPGIFRPNRGPNIELYRSAPPKNVIFCFLAGWPIFWACSGCALHGPPFPWAGGLSEAKSPENRGPPRAKQENAPRGAPALWPSALTGTPPPRPPKSLMHNSGRIRFFPLAPFPPARKGSRPPPPPSFRGDRKPTP